MNLPPESLARFTMAPYAFALAALALGLRAVLFPQESYIAYATALSGLAATQDPVSQRDRDQSKRRLAPSTAASSHRRVDRDALSLRCS